MRKVLSPADLMQSAMNETFWLRLGWLGKGLGLGFRLGFGFRVRVRAGVKGWG